jgi:hypothetical protein
MNCRRILIVSAFTLTFVTTLLAEVPIKSVDQSGNVTYSDKATVDAVSSTEVQINAGPTESQLDEAQKRSEQTIDSAAQAQAQRDALSAERKKAKQDKAAQTPDVVVIEGESGYPAYNPPLGSRPPIAIPPGNGGAQHPIYTPPAAVPLPAR